MKKMLAVVVLAVVLLSTLLGIKIISQRAALFGPAGGSGVVEATTVRLSSRVGGRIAEIPVREGQQVAQGDLVLELDCIEPDAMLAEAEARVESARRQADAADRAAEAAASAASAARAVAQAAGAQTRAVNAQGEAVARQANRLEAVMDDVSAAQRDQARAAADGAKAQTEAAEAQQRAGSAQAAAAEGQAGAALAQAEAARQAVIAGEAALERARVAAAECEVRAPRDGVVQLLPFEAGELVGIGATLAQLADLSVVQATFYLPNNDLAEARAGGVAEVRADAWPGKVFEGTVATVATEPEFTPRNIQTRSDRDRLVYKVQVDVPNQDGQLRPGMPVEVTLRESD